LNTQEIIDLEQKYLVQTYKRPPFVLDGGKGVYLFDTEGGKYLDLVSGIAVTALGYGDEGMEAVMREQASKPLHVSNLYHTAPHAKLAQKLVETSFADRVFFCNSGTEAVEGALKFARKWARTTDNNPEKYEVVSFTHAFHGRSMGALSTTAKEKYRAPFEPLIGGVHFAEFNSLEAAKALMGANTAAVIVEPVQGEGGIMPARAQFLAGLRTLCDQHGALLIFDEIQCGMGRTGTLWAHEAAGVEPDILTVAKPLGGGLPIGAILVTERVAQVMQPGDHGSTFAGGSFVSAVAGYVFDRIADPALLDHVKEVGGYLGELLSQLMTDVPAIREIRGRGLMWGIELDESVSTADVVNAGYEHGLLLVGAGRNTIRLVPPLIIEQSHIDELVEKLHSILTQGA
jgi:acetylornithine/N-succinyldiaminopimelate aminotransferase